mmetsp:Transcript_11621/g.14199  ORF Transcript_11621/g.14199 Transcript_11621/m.14199 type:complete len:555 (-) Transcript_11621:433-2097(-)
MSSEVGSFSYETTSNVNQPSAEGKSTFNRPSNITGTAPSVSGLAQPDTQPTNISGSLQKNSKNNMSQIASPTTNITTPFDEANMDETDGVRAPKTNGTGNNNSAPTQVDMASSFAALQVGGSSGAANSGSATTTTATTEEARPNQPISLTPTLASGGHNLEASQALAKLQARAAMAVEAIQHGTFETQRRSTGGKESLKVGGIRENELESTDTNLEISAAAIRNGEQQKEREEADGQDPQYKTANAQPNDDVNSAARSNLISKLKPQELSALSQSQTQQVYEEAMNMGLDNSAANAATKDTVALTQRQTEEEEEEEEEEELEEEEEEGSSEISASDEDGSWIAWFCSLRGNEFFCEIDEDYIQDDFNLTGLNSLVPYYDYALDMVLDVELPMEDSLTEEQQEIVESAAEMLYGLIHARYIVTNRGMHAMFEKYRAASFGRCPRVFCQGQPVLPVGLSDLPRNYTVNVFCPRCHGLFFPKSTRQANVDGAYFGTTFPHLYLMTHPDMIPARPTQVYVPRVYGFKIHPSSLYFRNHEEHPHQEGRSRRAKGRQSRK